MPQIIGVVREFTGFELSKEDQYAKFGGIEHKTRWAAFNHFSDDKTLLYEYGVTHHRGGDIVDYPF